MKKIAALFCICLILSGCQVDKDISEATITEYIEPTDVPFNDEDQIVLLSNGDYTLSLEIPSNCIREKKPDADIVLSIDNTYLKINIISLQEINAELLKNSINENAEINDILTEDNSGTIFYVFSSVKGYVSYINNDSYTVQISFEAPTNVYTKYNIMFSEIIKTLSFSKTAQSADLTL